MEIVGHYHQRDSLSRMAKNQQIPSGLMFAGAEGIGKQLVAKALAKALIANDYSELLESKEVSNTESSALFNSGNHPDFYFVECADKSFNIEALRELLYKLHLKTFNSNSRVIVLNDANALSIQAANALLKTLEEPRPGTYFILICSNPTMMPSTIRSRCQLWFFDRLKDSEITSIIKSQGLESKLSIEERAKIADGTMRNLSELEKHFDIWPEIQESLKKIVKGNTFEAHNFADKLGKDKDSLKEKIHLMRLYARREMLETRNQNTKRSWALFLNDCIESEYLVFQRNFNATYVLTSIFSNLSNSSLSELNSSSSETISQILVN